jgi:DNA polymerase elongation subunit (family B)
LSFYTCVNRYGNSILVRGYTSEGKPFAKKVKYKPTLFLPSQKKTDWIGIDGTPVQPFQLNSMSEATDFAKEHGEISNLKIYGNQNYVAQFIQDEFPGQVKHDRSKIDVGNIDIEVASDDGFPEPAEAAHPVISIAYLSSREKIFHVWGLGDYDAYEGKQRLKNDYADYLIQYRKCEDEHELMEKFLIYWENNTPDVITGWNVRLFDIPYMINRVKNIMAESETKRFSPWRQVNYRQIGIKGKSLDAYEIYGVQQMDYYDIFQKFGYSYGTQESYTLDHIANTVLGEKKLSYEEHGTLHTLYKNDHQKFIDYNIRDVLLVDALDKYLDLMDLAMIVAYKGGVNYMDSFGTTGIWDSLIYRYLYDKKIAVPPTKHQERGDYPGGYVKDPHVGMTEWVTSFDLNSLYPNLIVQYNMSPETLVEDAPVLPTGVDYYLKYATINDSPPHNEGVPYAVAANGACFKKDQRGHLPDIIIGLYDERKAVKRQMLDAKQEFEQTKNESLKREINKFDNMQMAVKILLNSLYGALGNQYFRYYDLRVAEGITLSGQLAVRWAEENMNKYLNKILKTDKDYVIAMDTDSIYVNFGPLVKAIDPKDPVKFIDDACNAKFQPMLQKAYDEMYAKMNAYDNRMVMEREVIADKAVWTAKKRYIMNVHNSEGVQYAEPKLKIQGIEAVKSSTPMVVRDKFKKAYKIILTSTEFELQKFVKDFYDEFKTLSPEQVSFPRGVSEINKWTDSSMLGYKKGTPIHVRGAILYNKAIKEKGLMQESLKNGSKVKFCYLKTPNPLRENVVSFPQFLPKELDLHNYVDYDLQFDKTFKDPLKIVTDVIGWQLEKIATLESLFS